MYEVIRRRQFVLIGSTLLGSWLGMQALHEFGHVVGAWMTGGTVTQVVLHPLTISRTDLSDNPRPLVVVWTGPVIGVAIPLLLWAGASMAKMPGAFVLRFFAGFCLLVNGLYISVGSFGRVGDCATMLAHGSQPWQLWLFGAITAPFGLWLWNGQGANFGLGNVGGQVHRGVALGTLIVSLSLLVLGLAVGGE